ncbi:hypothetical protein HPC49_14930 [Pyxidicoccus fallax]|uniref:Uncharacterized protein n=1 Tax=Pyxidicoccus fallax TaxID=394095 RepID=A0A848LEH4_9BACT|nr:hypothetical protein [Pyxidicoccus fallax]NMO14641.1 hypothetical protein [Pyxidicoccus fallax]NPC79526.1 hypothetical protein [Pyxidicoccus fallax]
MVETKEVQQDADLKKLDAQKVEALRGHLRKLLATGQGHAISTMPAVAELPPVHSSYGDGDGWI